MIGEQNDDSFWHKAGADIGQGHVVLATITVPSGAVYSFGLTVSGCVFILLYFCYVFVPASFPKFGLCLKLHNATCIGTFATELFCLYFILFHFSSCHPALLVCVCAFVTCNKDYLLTYLLTYMCII